MPSKFAAVALALVACVGHAKRVQTSGAFNPTVGVHTPKHTSSRAAGATMGDILSTAAGVEGPAMYWGSAGVLEGHDESDIKGYDNIGKFVAAIEKAGLADTLKGDGPFTVFAPTDSVLEYYGEVTPDILKYHIVKGKVPSSSLSSADLTTLQGGKLTYKRFARKDFVDDAMVGVKSAGASRSQNYPCDIEASNGVIHTINAVLTPK